MTHTQQLPKKGEFPVKVISSFNGLRATERAYQMILDGADTLDAVIAGVNIVEDDPADMTVGYGGLPNADGVVELDAAVMHGPTHRAGAVGALQKTRTPTRVAKRVMEQTDHVLLAGEGAMHFARANGFPEENLLTDQARKIWTYWKELMSAGGQWIPPPPEDVDPAIIKRFIRSTGTIHCAAIDADGDISCATSTSGLAFKMPGRVGDSAIIGAGLYVDNAIGSCGSTGRGEANLENVCSYAAVELMRNGMTPEEAGLEVLRRVAANVEPRLQKPDGKPTFNLKFYLIGKHGTHAATTMWGPATYAITDKDGTRLEECTVLYMKEEE